MSQPLFNCCEETPGPWQLLWKKAFNWGWLTGQKFSPLSVWWETCHHTGRCDAGEIAGSPVSGFIGSRKRESLGLEWAFQSLKAYPQGYASSNKTTSSNPLKQCHLLVTKYSNLWASGGHSHQTTLCPTLTDCLRVSNWPQPLDIQVQKIWFITWDAKVWRDYRS